jgi:histidinol-phosphate aminotransferase
MKLTAQASRPARGGAAAKAAAARFRPVIEAMAPYVPGEQPRPGERLIKLNTNENPYPPSPRVRRAIAQAIAGEALRLYPPPRADEFIDAAGRFYRLPSSMIVAGNGSDELLAMLFRAALSRGDKVAWGAPTYSLYDTLAAIQEARVIAIRFPRDFRLPVEALARARARLTIVCNPNSPSGTLVEIETLDALARALDGRLLAIDEAYVDFADGSALDLVRRHANVIVLRTLSKSFSLAGMRLGLGVAAPALIEHLLKVKDSYNLSRVAIAAGAAALGDPAWMRRNVERVRKTRRLTEDKLRAMGFEVPESSANFVMARMVGHDLAPIAAGLRARGILVRYFATPMLRDALRISIGTPAEMTRLFAALKPLLASLRATAGDGFANSR